MGPFFFLSQTTGSHTQRENTEGLQAQPGTLERFRIAKQKSGPRPLCLHRFDFGSIIGVWNPAFLLGLVGSALHCQDYLESNMFSPKFHLSWRTSWKCSIQQNVSSKQRGLPLRYVGEPYYIFPYLQAESQDIAHPNCFLDSWRV